jgi:NADH-quinone oxidoreductase subunit M
MIPADISLFSIVALTGLEKAFATSIAEAVPAIGGNILLTILCSIGFLAKAAVAPLHFWLPDAHFLAPAPASAMLSGLMVKMGIYGLYILYRYYPINVDAYAYLLIVFGSLTAIYGGMHALVQIDIKRVLAYSTISHTDVIAILLEFAKLFNVEPALYATLFSSVAHAFFKSVLFVDSGFVEIVTHTRNIEKLGFISRLSPLESIATLTAVLSLIGAPPLPGFVSKFLTLLSIASSIGTPVALMLLIVIAFEIALSVGYGIRYLAVHFGSSIIKVEPLEELAMPKEMSVCVIISAVVSIIITVYLLLISWTTYTMALIYLTVVSSLFLSVILYVIQNSQKVARLEEVWVGGARP